MYHVNIELLRLSRDLICHAAGRRPAQPKRRREGSAGSAEDLDPVIERSGCGGSRREMAPKRISSNARAGGALSTVGIVVITCVVIFSLQHLGQLTTDLKATTAALDSGGNPGGLRSASGGSSPFGVKIPEGLAVALPSVPTTAEEEKEIKRSIYGGAGDKKHLGGFTSFDPQVSCRGREIVVAATLIRGPRNPSLVTDRYQCHYSSPVFTTQGVSPTLWEHMVKHLGVKSMLDLGCGRGISTSWFITHGLEYVVCAGSCLLAAGWKIKAI